LLAQDTKPEILDPVVPEVIVGIWKAAGPFGVGCVWTELEFAGKVLYKDERRRKQPLLSVDFWHHPLHSSPQKLNIDVAIDGSFTGKVHVVDHIYFSTKPNGKRKESTEYGSTIVVLTAPGCIDKSVVINRRWRDKAIVMKCPNSPSSGAD